ncbi:MAG: hypothetical protein IJS54_01640 [Desulfovibrio sp.]|nr:hypothetical protein [Desulfovibrio sp.]
MTMPLELIVGAMPKNRPPQTVLCAGPWCFAGQEEAFPEWEKTYTFCPEPLRDPHLAELAPKASQALAARMLAPCRTFLAKKAPNLPDIYWETLLLPWIVAVAEQVVERWLRIQAIIATFHDTPLRVTLAPSATWNFRDDQDYILRGALGVSYNTWLFSHLLQKAALPTSWIITLDQTHVIPPTLAPQKRSLKKTLASLLLSLPFPRIKGFTLAESLRFSLALCHRSHGEDGHRLLAQALDPTILERVGLPNDLEPIFLASLPKSLCDLSHPQTIRPSKHPHIRCASILFYEDARYRQDMALWLAKGNRLFFIQHGGNYGQILHPCRTRFVEYSQHAFISWGWQSHAGSPAKTIPLPQPSLARLANQAKATEDTLIFVGTEMPLYGYRLDSHPTPLELISYRDAKKTFLAHLPTSIHPHIRYRPYFPVPSSLSDAPWLCQHFPDLALCKGPLAPHLLRCRLLVLDHHGTTLLEAMAANIPLVLYWNPVHWPLCADSQKSLDELAQAGIWFDTPRDAAAAVATLWDDVAAWWQDPLRQRARASFCHTYAHFQSPHLASEWVHTLRTL